MSDMRSLALTRAYELVEAGKSDEARTVLEPILLNDRDNVDAWWIYAHAVDDPVEARRALDHVMRLDRSYPGAAELLATLNQQYPDEIPEPVPAVATEPDFADLEPEFADDDSFVEEQRYTPVAVLPQENRSRSWLPVLAVLAILAVLFIVLVLILPNLNQDAPPTPTSVAVLPEQITDPTAVIVIPPTEEATEVLIAPEVTEVALLDVTPLGEEPVEMTEEAELEATTAAILPEVTEAVEVEPTESGEAVEEATEEASTVSPLSVALAATDTTAQMDATLSAEEASPTADIFATLDEAAVTAEIVVEVEPTETEADAVTLTPTQEVGEVIDLTAEAEAEATDESDIDAAVDYEERLETALQSFAVAEPAIEEVETDFGATVLARVCTSEGLMLRETLRSVMELLANEAETLPENLSGVGVRLINCDMDRTLRIIAVDRQSAASFADDTLNDTQFEANWRSQ